MIPKPIKKVLPKAPVLTVEVHQRGYFAKFRGANFTRWQIGPICITHRSAWLEGPARALHPHLFNLTRKGT